MFDKNLIFLDRGTDTNVDAFLFPGSSFRVLPEFPMVQAIRWRPLAPVARQRTNISGNNTCFWRSVGARWHPLARQRTRLWGNKTCYLRSVGARWHPLARQRTKIVGSDTLSAIRWRSPRLAYIIINGCGVGASGARGRRVTLSIVVPT